MKCGFSVSTPASRLADECRMQAFLAWVDAAQRGPVWFQALHEHDYRPVTNMRAVYRCATCSGFAYKSKVRTGVVGDNGFTPYTCRHPGCKQPVVVMFPTVRARRTLRPSCAEHRPDKP